jgi:cysteinyl-tRNA synthetase
MNFTFEALQASKQALFRLKRIMYEEYKNAKGTVNESYRAKFHAAINDDLDTPKAIALIWEIIKDSTLTPGDKIATIREIDTVLDIGLSDAPEDAIHELGIIEEADVPDEIQKLLDERQIARTTHNWPEADRLREVINFKGYTVEDTPQGQKISKSEA